MAAQELLQQAIAVRQEFFPNSLELAAFYFDLAVIEEELKNLEESRQYLQQAIALCEKYGEQDHPELSGYYFNLATVEQKLGDTDEATKHLQKAIKMREQDD